MSCILPCDELANVGLEELVRSLIVKDDNGCFALRSTGSGGGGGYTFPSNSGNTAYVSDDGDDGGSAEIGNISKPYSSLNTAIAELDNNIPATIIILSNAGGKLIDGYDLGTMPTDLYIQDLTTGLLRFEGVCSFGTLTIKTLGNIEVATTLFFQASTRMNIECDSFAIKGDATGVVDYDGVIKCNDFIVEDNENMNVDADVIEWLRSATLNTGNLASFVYNKCTPRVYRAIINQGGGTDAPVATVLENTLGGVLVWTYINTGLYLASFPVGVDGTKAVSCYRGFLFEADAFIDVYIEAAQVSIISTYYSLYDASTPPTNQNSVFNFNLKIEVYL